MPPANACSSGANSSRERMPWGSFPGAQSVSDTVLLPEGHRSGNSLIDPTPICVACARDRVGIIACIPFCTQPPPTTKERAYHSPLPRCLITDVRFHRVDMAAEEEPSACQACGARLGVRAALGPAAIVALGSVTTGRPWMLPTICWLATSSNTPAALKRPLLTGRNSGRPVVSNSANSIPHLLGA